MSDFVATNAASSGIRIDKKRLKALARRSDVPGLVYIAQWLFFLALTGGLVWMSLGTWWVWPAMFLHGIFLTVPGYALSHETAHGTAFKTRWLNETVLWVTSFIYFEEPLHRRYTHTSHHTYTWHVGKDSQMPFDTPMAFGGWVAEITGLGLARFHISSLFAMAMNRPSDIVRSAIPDGEMPKLVRNARLFLLACLGVVVLIAFGYTWPLLHLAVVVPDNTAIARSPGHVALHADPACRDAGKLAIHSGIHTLVQDKLAGTVSVRQHEQSRRTSPVSTGAVLFPA